MNRKLFFLIAPIFSVVSVLMLSSFFNPQENPTDCDDPEPTPKIKYRGQSKKSSKNGLIRMSSGFQNDYFTNNKNEGFYYIEIVRCDRSQREHEWRKN